MRKESIKEKAKVVAPKYSVKDVAALYGITEYKFRVFCLRAGVGGEDLVDKEEFGKLYKKVYGINLPE